MYTNLNTSHPQMSSSAPLTCSLSDTSCIIELERSVIRTNISKYFGDIILTKTLEKQVSENETISIFHAKVGCMLCLDNRYLVVITSNDRSRVGDKRNLSEVAWTSFQTRTIPDFNLNSNPLIKGLKSQNITQMITQTLSDSIRLNEKKLDRCTYFANTLPLKIELLFTEESNSYAERGTIQSALDTYNCVINFSL